MKPEKHDIDDKRLESVGQLAIREVVRSLPDESLSMAWRSGLNERLLEASARQQRQRRIWWVARPLAGLSMALALAFVIVFHPAEHRSVPIPDQGIESAILNDHHVSTLSNELSAAGLNLNEVSTDVNETDPDYGALTEDDVDSL